MAPRKVVKTEEVVKVDPVVDTKAMLERINKAGLPQVATGGDLSNWKADLATISKIEVLDTTTNGSKWVTIEGEGSAKIPSLQHRCMLALAVASYQAPRTDRGFAYQTWVSDNSPMLKAVFGKYSVRVWHTKATLPCTEYSVDDILALAAIHAPALRASIAIAEPVRKSRGVSSKVEEEEIEFVL